MADIALDYGSADPAPDAMAQDESMREADQVAGSSGSRFYALPTDQAVEAGAQRGPGPLTEEQQKGMDDATLMGPEEPSELPDPPAIESGSDVILDVLLIQGEPITQLSTSRLFAYLTHYGAQPLGLEWIDDSRCKIVFADERSARLGLEYLCPAVDEEMESESPSPLPNLDTLIEYDPDSWPSEFISALTNPRKAHRVPGKLYNAVERQAVLSEQEEDRKAQEAVASLPDDVPEIYREMQEEDRKKTYSREVRALKKLRAALWIRHAVQDVDRKEARASKRSQWYKQHGYEAGREIVPKLLQVGEVRDSVELFPNYQPGSAVQTTNGSGDRRAMMDQLDAELDGHAASRDAEQYPERREGEMMADAIQARPAARGQGGDLFDRLHSSRGTSDSRWSHDAFDQADGAGSAGRHGGRREGRRSRGRANVEDLDEELERMNRSRQHQREASPGRKPYADSGRVKVKGRGRMKAPGMASAWDNDDSADWSRTQTPPTGHRNATHRDRQNDRWIKDEEEEKKDLASRLNNKGELLDRLGGSKQRLADRFS